MKHSLDYMVEKNNELRRNYVTPEFHEESCLTIALQLFMKRLVEVGDAKILKIEPRRREENSPNTIHPSVYGGSIAWFRHFVCISKGEAWDPVFKEPKTLKNYLDELFPGEELNLEWMEE